MRSATVQGVARVNTTDSMTINASPRPISSAPKNASSDQQHTLTTIVAASSRCCLLLSQMDHTHAAAGKQKNPMPCTRVSQAMEVIPRRTASKTKS